jgi:hypothetical protein
MHCLCCDADVPVGRKAKARRCCDYDPARGGPDSAPYLAYTEQTTYRWAFLCEDCYRRLDNEDGMAVVRGQTFNLAGASRRGKARAVYEAEYRAFQRQEAAKLGLDLPDESG